MNRTVGCMMAVVVVMSSAVSTRAQEGAWQFSVTPYIWCMGLDGDVGVGRVTAPVDVEFADAVKDLKLGGMLAVEANNGTWGVLADACYLKLSDDTVTPAGDVGVEVKEWILRGAAVYRLYSSEKTLLDLGLGARYVGTDVEMDWPSERADLSRSKEWTDPIVVARVRQHFTEKWFGVLEGDIGGFGVSSDLTWQLTAAAGYSISERVSMLLGYRYLDYDYKDDGFSYDVATGGVAVGVTIGL